jgi:CYTH domain-containing protein
METIAAVVAEMDSAGNDVRFELYTQTHHAFDNPDAGSDPNARLVYSPTSARRAMAAIAGGVARGAADDAAGSGNEYFHAMSQYASIERERRFLIARFPGKATVDRVREITDYYIEGTNLRLREMRDIDGPRVYKLTQKLPGPRLLITTIYLSEPEFRVVVQLPAARLCKTRYSVPPFGIDVFDGTLEGLILAEAEFDSDAAAAALILPAFIGHEVTSDDRFSGGRLVRAARPEIATWLSEYGLSL